MLHFIGLTVKFMQDVTACGRMCQACMSTHIIDRMLIHDIDRMLIHDIVNLTSSHAMASCMHMQMKACALAIDPHLFAYDLLTPDACIWFLISRGTVLSCPAVHDALERKVRQSQALHASLHAATLIEQALVEQTL